MVHNVSLNVGIKLLAYLNTPNSSRNVLNYSQLAGQRHNAAFDDFDAVHRPIDVVEVSERFKIVRVGPRSGYLCRRRCCLQR